jgi:hypothetical protein
VAEYLLSMQLPQADQQRVNELSAKARAGSLSESETQELDSYLHIGRLLAVMQSRARRLLNNPDADLVLLDEWLERASISSGAVFRPLNKGGRILSGPAAVPG